jgi:hypothetical protein
MNAAEIAGQLSDRILKLVEELLPNGRRDGREWRVGNIAGEAGSSLSVRLIGPKAGLWHDFATGESDDALNLVRAALFVWSGEDDFEDTLLSRFLAAGGDPDRIFPVQHVINGGDKRAFDPGQDIPML